MLSILTFAVLGTIITAVSIGGVAYGLGYAGWSPVDNVIECMLFGSLLSATDPVATLSLFLELNVDPLLYSLVFGESVLNDAVAIALFRTLSKFVGNTTLGWKTIGQIVGQFLLISFGSTAIGVAIGFISAFVMKQAKRLKLSPTYEVTLIGFVAYISYLVAEVATLSGIISLFVCSVMMSHYHWYSIGQTSRTTAYHTSGAIAFVAETAVFVSMGLTLFETDDPFTKDLWNPVFVTSSFGMIFISRALNVFPLSLVLNFARKVRIPFKHQIVMWFAGLRGAIAIILALNLSTSHATLITNTTYAIVLFTNLAIGIATKPLLHCLKIESGGDKPVNVRNPDASLSTQTGHTPSSMQYRRGRIHQLWVRFDEGFMKPLFGGRQRPTADSEQQLLVNDDEDQGREASVRTNREFVFTNNEPVA
eukprot:TRINITY_DN6631_c0_g1_i2.p1 TRINITY_DN6631_c0_g1~~TRINITY_DN6631_c0_g1_i2.p1  ORF type:complete len:421 (+),score=77.03 TRINITY_DN6631_c0_g1_i2:415-1677(+)